MCNFFNRINNFKDLAIENNIKYNYINTPNDKNLLNNINKNNKKISLLLTNHILKNKIIKKKKTFFYK